MKRLIVLLVLLMSSVVMAQEETETDDVVLYRDSIPAAETLAFETVVDNLVRPLFVTYANDSDERLYIVEQRGRINVVENGTLSIFMDISNLVSPEAGGLMYTERGLLGLAFHPEYADNGMFFVNYTNPDGATIIARYSVSDDPLLADTESGEIIFTANQPFANHNGGHMAFGPDGNLYVSLGDGGSAGDPLQAGQDPTLLLGTIMRINVDGETGYTIPEDNPFVGSDAGADEVWSYGWRNPWRFSFDRATGDMYIADVGQNQLEEVNFEAAGSVGGLNYGWNFFEATNVFAEGGNIEETQQPFAQYDHSRGCSVTGGYVYRGEALPDWQGVYFYGDYCTGRLWTAYRTAEDTWVDGELMQTPFSVSSFGEGPDGELYLVNYGGTLERFVAAE